MELSDFMALSFDCYGTLIDWEAGLREAIAPLATRLRTQLPGDDLLALFGRLESAQQAAAPHMHYPDILASVFRRMAESLDLDVTEAECRHFGQSVGEWPAFEDSAPALAQLQQQYRLFVLSNVDNASFAASGAKLGVTFDGVFTAEDIGSYKPSLRNFAYLLERLAERGIGGHQVLHVAQSLYHDHAPAKRLGFATAWIDRRQGRDGGATRQPAQTVSFDFRFGSLAALAEAARRGRSG